MCGVQSPSYFKVYLSSGQIRDYYHGRRSEHFPRGRTPHLSVFPDNMTALIGG